MYRSSTQGSPLCKDLGLTHNAATPVHTCPWVSGQRPCGGMQSNSTHQALHPAPAMGRPGERVRVRVRVKLFFFLFFFFLGLYLWLMEVPRLGVESDPGYATAIATPDLSHVCDLCNLH